MTTPETLGACADRLYDIKCEKAALQKQIDTLDEERKAIEEKLIQSLSKSDAGGVLGHKARAAVSTKEVPTVKDWPALYAEILRTQDFSLLQRRVGEAAVAERWAMGEVVPGVEPFQVIKVSVTKLGSK